STPLHVIASNGHRYYVKTQHNPHQQSSLLAEVIVHAAARYLGVPTPEYTLLHLPDVVAKAHSDHQGNFPHPGVCFASKEIEQAHHDNRLTYLTRDHNLVHGP